MNSITIFSLVLIVFQTLCFAKDVYSKGFHKKLWPGQGYEVHVVNNLPNDQSPLLIHCGSKNNELGNHTLHVKGDFSWSFRMNYGLSTMFFCRFRWGPRDKAFEVFNKHVALYCEGSHEKEVGNICYWSVKEDGFWIGYSIPPTVLEQLHQW